MNTKTLAAALTVAYAVAKVDGFADQETATLAKEMKSYNLSDEQKDRVLALYKEMSTFEAITIIRESSQEDTNEAEALTILTLLADNEVSDKEIGALKLMGTLCGFKGMDVEEAHRVIGF